MEVNKGLSNINTFQYSTTSRPINKTGQNTAAYAQQQYMTPAIAQTTRSNALNPNNGKYYYMGDFKLPYLKSPGKLYQLSNGQKVVIIPKKGPSVIRTFVKVGSFNEPDAIRGISHYIEHNLFNGSKEQAPGEFVEQVTKMGGKYNASTGFLTTDYYIKSPLHNKDDLQKFITMHADMVLNPTYSEQQLVKEKGPVTSEIQMLADNPGNIAVNTTLKSLFNIKSTSLDLIGGSVENIENLNRNKVLEYYNKWYTPDNMTTVIVGDVNPDQTIALLNKNFNKGQNISNKNNKYVENLVPISQPKRIDLSNPNIDSPLVNMAFVGPQNNDAKGIILAKALTCALTGYKNARLNKAIKALSLDTSMENETISPKLSDPSVIFLSGNFKPGQEEEGLRTIYSILHQMTYSPLSPQELYIVKNKLKNSLKFSSESAMAISSLVGHTMLDNGDARQLSNVTQMIDNITPNEIMDAARKFLNLNKTAITMLHPPKTKVTPTKASNISFSGSNTKLDIGNTTQYKLPNNMNFVANNISNTEMATISLKLTALKESNTRPGVAEILNQMLSFDTTKHSEEDFQTIADMNNVISSVNCGSRSITVDAVFPKTSISQGLEIIKESITCPKLNQENFERAKNELKLIYHSMRKSPVDRAIEGLYPNSALGNSLRKAIENIDSITLQEVTFHYKNIINNAKATGIVSTDFSNPNTMGQFTSGLSYGLPVFNTQKIKSKIIDKPLTKTKVITETETRNQADIVQIFKLKETGNIKDRAALLVLNEILGGNSNSRLFTDLREKQKLAYRVNSSYANSGKNSQIALRIMTTTENGYKGNQFENLKKSLDGFKKHIDLLMTKPATKDEIDAAKLKVKSGYIFQAESTVGKNSLLIESYKSPYATKYTGELIKALDEVTAENVQKIASYYLSKPSVISIIAGKNTVEANKEYLNTLGDLESY